MAFVALVTGASSGIGEATARRLAREPDGRLVLVARREERLIALAQELGGATVIAADLTDPQSAQRIASVVRSEHGALHLLVSNAGASWHASFSEGGWDNVARHLALNFEAQLRLTEALLPLLRETAAQRPHNVGSTGRPHAAQVSIVNVASTAGRIGRGGVGGYSASKFAFAGWSDALYYEELRHGVHVGLVLPGFVATEGFPQRRLVDRAATRWIVSKPDRVADAILDAGPGGRAERYVPRIYWVAAALRIVAPGLVRRVLGRRARQ